MKTIILFITLFAISPAVILADSTYHTKKNLEIRDNLDNKVDDNIIKSSSCRKPKKFGRSAGFSHHWSTTKQNCSRTNRTQDNNKGSNKLKIKIKIPFIIFKSEALYDSDIFLTFADATFPAVNSIAPNESETQNYEYSLAKALRHKHLEIVHI